jgi:hypothetical protein
MNAESKLRELFKDEFRMKVLRASVPEFVMLVELMLADLQKTRTVEAKRAFEEIEQLKRRLELENAAYKARLDKSQGAFKKFLGGDKWPGF